MTRPDPDFLEALKLGPMVLDGATGTQIYERGVFLNRNLEEVCLVKPTLVRSIHEDYIEAGAQVIESHTFGANRIKLSRYALADKTDAINRAAVQIALEAAGDKAFVAGSIGPTGTTPGVMTDEEIAEVRAAFREQALIMAEEGCQLIIIETFRLLSEMRLALEAVAEVCDLPVVAQMAFDSELRTADGADPTRAAKLLRLWGADVVGANCVEGPQVLFGAAEEMVALDYPVSCVPNAGYPRLQDDRLIYMATPEYFGVYARRYFKAGVALVGGCCGTSPDHIRQIAAAARMMGGGRSLPHREPGPITIVPEDAELPPVPMAQKSALAAKIVRVHQERVKAANPVALTPENFVVSVEVNPPSGLDPTQSIEAAAMLQAAGVDVINIADGPRATVRMNNQALALLVDRDLDMEVILHVCCRDRNLLGLQSDLLAAHVLGLHNVVIITGDPPKMGDYPHATAVFDLDSIGLLRLVHGLNRGIDPAGKVVGQTTGFLCACGAEPGALDYDREIRRLELKVASGAEFLMTQPVYDPALLERFLNDIAHLDLPVLVGLLPLASYRNAEFLHNEVPGMQIPEEIRERMRKMGKGQAARREGVRIAQECLMGVVDRVVGAYVMPPFGRYRAALEVLECVGYRAGS
jgi:methionine synthase / methylenetetrahydrofolate reductase(NADPH)